MNDQVDNFKAQKEHKKRIKEKCGVQCPDCKKRRPKASPSILLPGDRCNVDGYLDLRVRLTQDQWSKA